MTKHLQICDAALNGLSLNVKQRITFFKGGSAEVLGLPLSSAEVGKTQKDKTLQKPVNDCMVLTSDRVIPSPENFVSRTLTLSTYLVIALFSRAMRCIEFDSVAHCTFNIESAE
jgi:hypothetical protein